MHLGLCLTTYSRQPHFRDVHSCTYTNAVIMSKAGLGSVPDSMLDCRSDCSSWIQYDLYFDLKTTAQYAAAQLGVLRCMLLLPACLPVCLSACLPACLPAYLWIRGSSTSCETPLLLISDNHMHGCDPATWSQLYSNLEVKSYSSFCKCSKHLIVMPSHAAHDKSSAQELHSHFGQLSSTSGTHLY